MGVDPDVLRVVRAGVEADPENDALRLHFAGLLLEDAQPVEALGQAQRVLVRHPASIEALDLAHRAARDAHQDEAALGYFNLLSALRGRVDDSPVQPTLPAADLEPRLNLSDVAGMEAVKERLELAFLGPARNPELRRAFAKSLRGGLLLYGPPGCGKTFLAKAIAGELGAGFIAVGIPDVLDMWTGASERKVAELFARARRNVPCVLFLDELDALGQKRSNLRASPSLRNTVNQLLAELDGVTSDNDGLFVLGATNQPWDVDPALRRPGRLDRTLLVLPPDRSARLAILAQRLAERPADVGDLGPWADATDGFSGADLVHLVETATEFAVADSTKAGAVVPVSADHLNQALGQVRSSVGPWLDAARNVAKFANESGEYDELAAYLDKRGRR